MTTPFQLVPATRAVGTVNPPGDMNNTSLQLAALGGSYNVLNSAFGTADPTGTAASDTAFNNAIGALGSNGGATLIPPGNYKITSGIVASTANAGIYLIPVCGPGTVTLSYYGSGDCVRMNSTNGTSPPGNGGGILGGIILDMTHATGSASGLHLGDFFQPRLDVKIQNNPAGTIALWLDNQYTFTEQITGTVAISGNAGTGVQFDNSTGTGTSANATGSFDRLLLKVLVAGATGDIVKWANGAFAIDYELGIYGNAVYGASKYYVINLTGSNAGGFSRLDHAGILNAGVELRNPGSGVQPGTINFNSQGNNIIQGAKGILDFSGNAAFAAATNPRNSFQFDGPVFGDSTLNRSAAGVQAFNVAGGLSNGGTIYSTTDVVTALPGSNWTGMILQKWDTNMGLPSKCTVINGSAANSITFAAAGTSFVADGTSDVILPNTAATYYWDGITSLWYRTT